MIRRVEGAFCARGMVLNSEGWAFNKGRVAKLLLTELPKQSVADLPSEMIGYFEQLFKCINDAMPGFEDVPVLGKMK